MPRTGVSTRREEVTKLIVRGLHLFLTVMRVATKSPKADIGYRRELQPLDNPRSFQMQLNTLLGEAARP
jgi:hypothetical protein